MEESEWKEQIRLDDERIRELEKVIKEIPECVAHGDLCLPHAIEWIRRVKTLAKVITGEEK